MRMSTARRSSVRITSATSQRRLKPESEPAVKKFVKIIDLSTIKENMMKVPDRYVRLGPKLTDNVIVETPVGFKRSFRIKRIGDEVWFERGWSEFAEAHSLRKDHFLLFHYQGKSSFRVVIFDGTASEIMYPLDKVYVTESDDDKEEVIEVMDDDEEGFAGFESGEGKGVIDLDELLNRKKPRVSIKSEKVTTFDDVVQID